MTSKLTREWLQEAISDIQTRRNNGSISWDDERENILNTFEIALAAMGSESLYTVQPPSSDLALQNFRDAMVGIEHIRRALEETFGGLHGTHSEPDILVDCKQIVDAIYAAYRSAGNANSASPTGRVISIRQKAWDEFDWWSAASARLWLEASPQPADLQTRSLVMWIKRLSLALRSASPDNKLPKAAMGYLQKNGLISIADCLRGNNEEPPA
ncbi:hypothetical protein KAM260_47460 [Klebsiella pneumoniae]|uniref:hypothetical protein n=1 Tax=Klebsiella TaxID=570 RepID=UPI001D0E897C|nr:MULTISPECIES: hypothetical protein [Klebsiella]MEE1969334.1 hypothetical protein [Klebsiella michiganensis]BCH46855.1 hypothetical protein KAM260_47460 [Klebsiella pneumoniae]